jgi:8-oxo-dGTP pyrophosphatase MutT (NUDIX family)
MNINEILKIKSILKNYRRNKLKATGKCASVLIPLTIKNNNLFILLTKRTSNLREHSGEYSFPGGIQEKNESLMDTALRETKEEIGINKSQIEIIGKLDDEISIGKYRVTPFVAFVNIITSEVFINSKEVEKIIYVPIDFFLKKETFWEEKWIRLGKYRTVYFYLYKNEIIWGLTGKMIYKFLKLLKL